MKTPQWVERAKKAYAEAVSIGAYSETNFSRGNIAIEFLDNIVLPERESIDILLVGPGHGFPLLCSSEPYRISAHLEEKGIDYTLEIVDKDPDVINDLRARRLVMMQNSDYENPDNAAIAESWNKYLSQTSQVDHITHVPMTEIAFDDLTIPEQQEEALLHGIMYASAPTSYLQKLDNGEITMREEDIALTSFDKKFQFASCLNVLVQIAPPGRLLALYNMSSALEDGGYLLVDDLAQNPFLIRNRQFDAKRQRGMKLSLVDTIEGHPVNFYLFQKQA